MITLQNVSKKYDNRSVLNNVSLEAEPGEVVAVMGPNGCGKSTLLKLLAGFETPTSGAVGYGTEQKPKQGVVFQKVSESLFPWLTVGEHLKAAESDQAKKILHTLGLTNHKHKYPYELSGGMAQLTAIARAASLKPDIFLLDEPFAALDYYTCLSVMEKFAELWYSNKTTTVIVTHTLEEAIFLADRVVVLSPSPGTVAANIPVTLERPRRRECIGSTIFKAAETTVFKHLSGFV